MQTFLPYPNFAESAEALDKKRCWKQVVETAQILDILENPNSNKPKAWQNHPAVKMWEGHTKALRVYFNSFLWQAKNIHKINTKYEYLEFDNFLYGRDTPWWWNMKKFHRSHRARLIDKDPEFYLNKFKKKDQGYNDGKYWWPDMNTKSFKTI